ncbi:hypothetical protein NDU88_007175 [Pleurodeles waltl]|uniref:Uncharacterized protein n=1 Tax=Pleurodeles waltl TaxID=8319 RepID=A0AAV7SS27_PLEWA|nr:hypothetical protein NDU88_007175 [Pleurodeles waltl]
MVCAPALKNEVHLEKRCVPKQPPGSLPDFNGHHFGMTASSLSWPVSCSLPLQPTPACAPPTLAPTVLSRNIQKIIKDILRDANLRGQDLEKLYGGREVEPRGTAP